MCVLTRPSVLGNDAYSVSLFLHKRFYGSRFLPECVGLQNSFFPLENPHLETEMTFKSRKVFSYRLTCIVCWLYIIYRMPTSLEFVSLYQISIYIRCETRCHSFSTLFFYSPCRYSQLAVNYVGEEGSREEETPNSETVLVCFIRQILLTMLESSFVKKIIIRFLLIIIFYQFRKT